MAASRRHQQQARETTAASLSCRRRTYNIEGMTRETSLPLALTIRTFFNDGRSGSSLSILLSSSQNLIFLSVKDMGTTIHELGIKL